jgi:hypothetical protein
MANSSSTTKKSNALFSVRTLLIVGALFVAAEAYVISTKSGSPTFNIRQFGSDPFWSNARGEFITLAAVDAKPGGRYECLALWFSDECRRAHASACDHTDHTA